MIFIPYFKASKKREREERKKKRGKKEKKEKKRKIERKKRQWSDGFWTNDKQTHRKDYVFFSFCT